MTRDRSASPSRHGLAIVEDCCQAHLATAAGRPVGTIGVAGAFSFYPTKNLGALGDGGAVVTNDRGARRDACKRLRNGGQTDRYHHQEPGVNSRLDEMQAAILRARLPLSRAAGPTRRRALAARYRSRAGGAPVDVPPRVRCRPRLSSVRRAHGRRAATRCRRISPRAASKRWCTTRCRFRSSRRSPPQHPADCPGRDRGCATKSCRCRSIPRLRDDDVDEVAAAVHAFESDERTDRACADHRRRRVHRLASLRSAARRRATRCWSSTTCRPDRSTTSPT